MAFVEKGTGTTRMKRAKTLLVSSERPWFCEEKFFVIRSGGIKRNGARVTEQLNRRVCPPRINRVTKLDFRALSFNPRAFLNRPQRRSSSGRIDEWKENQPTIEATLNALVFVESRVKSTYVCMRYAYMEHRVICFSFFILKLNAAKRVASKITRHKPRPRRNSAERRLNIIQGIRGTKGPLSARFAHLTTGS